MMGSQEWMNMIDQEIKELQRLIDRKAEKQQIAKFKVAYESTQKKNHYFMNIIKNDSENLDSSVNDDSSNIMKNSSSGSIIDELNQNKKITPTDTLQAEYHFGHDLHTDFATLFGAFNRVAKNKLDKTVLSDFASVSFIDSLYERKSIAFSSQLTDSYHLYYRHFDEKITNLSNKISQFHKTVISRLNEMDSLTKNLRNRLNRMFTTKRQIEQEKNDEEFIETIDLNENQEDEQLKTSRSESKLISSSRISAVEMNFDKQKKFAKTIVIKRTPLVSHHND